MPGKTECLPLTGKGSAFLSALSERASQGKCSLLGFCPGIPGKVMDLSIISLRKS
jgi:hypothetical protein